MSARYAKVSEVSRGTRLVADDGFSCLNNGDVVEVGVNKNGDLFVPCSSEGGHSLDGQLDDGDEYIGFTLAPDPHRAAEDLYAVVEEWLTVGNDLKARKAIREKARAALAKARGAQ